MDQGKTCNILSSKTSLYLSLDSSSEPTAGRYYSTGIKGTCWAGLTEFKFHHELFPNICNGESCATFLYLSFSGWKWKTKLMPLTERWLSSLLSFTILGAVPGMQQLILDHN